MKHRITLEISLREWFLWPYKSVAKVKNQMTYFRFSILCFTLCFIRNTWDKK
jgi:hypothetical protein